MGRGSKLGLGCNEDWWSLQAPEHHHTVDCIQPPPNPLTYNALQTEGLIVCWRGAETVYGASLHMRPSFQTMQHYQRSPATCITSNNVYLSPVPLLYLPPYIWLNVVHLAYFMSRSPDLTEATKPGRPGPRSSVLNPAPCLPYEFPGCLCADVFVCGNINSGHQVEPEAAGHLGTSLHHPHCSLPRK